MSLLVAACRVEVVRDGQAHSPALPNLQTEPLPSGATALKRLGIGHVELEAYWRGAKNRADDACLPVAWLLEFVPGGLWPAVRTLVAWGPYEAGTRAEEAVALLAETPIRCGTRRRAAGSPIAAGTLESRVDCLWGLMQALLELRAKVQASANPSLSFVLLEQWTVRPERVDVKACGAKEAHLDNSGPPVQDCADNLLRLYQNYQGALPHRRYLRLRRLLFQALLALIGPREDALRMLDVDDYLPEHVAADGVRGRFCVSIPARPVTTTRRTSSRCPRSLPSGSRFGSSTQAVRSVRLSLRCGRVRSQNEASRSSGSPPAGSTAQSPVGRAPMVAASRGRCSREATTPGSATTRIASGTPPTKQQRGPV